MTLALLLVLAALRVALGLLLHRADPSSGGPGAPPVAPSSSAWVAIGLWAIIPLKWLMWLAQLLGGDWSALPWLAAGLLVLFPGPIVQRLLVPAGWWRLASAVTHLSLWRWRGDVAGGALLASAQALTARPARASGSALATLVKRRDQLDVLRGGGILASALMAELRGDHDTMLSLTRSVLWLNGEAVHTTARGLAAQWLAAEAAQRGDWSQVERLCRGVASLPPGARLLAAIADLQLSEAPGRRQRMRLLAAWLTAPHRRRTWPTVAAALRSRPGPHSDPDTADTDNSDHDASTLAPSEADPTADTVHLNPDERLRLAVAAHARICAGPSSAAAVVDLARAWQEALDSAALSQAVAARAEAIGARRGDPMAAARAQVTEELVALVRGTSVDLSALHDPPALLVAAAAQVESAAMAEVEASWAPIERRRKLGETLPTIDEWREFIALRVAYDAAVALRGDAGRRLLFDDTDTAVSNLAARLFNDRDERSLANAMFAWLLPEAEAINDREAIGRLTRNVRCGA